MPLREPINRIRQKLLNISSSNRLINFKHSAKSSVRVIDEVPSFLYETIVGGDPLYFKPLPPQTGEYVEKYNNTQNIREVNRKDVLTDQAQQISKEMWAKFWKINNNFDLPEDVCAKRHEDKYIQTYLYPDELESVLRQLCSKAHTAIEETGANMLFLSFGFLQWAESQQEQTRLAPLVLVPIIIEKDALDKKTGTFLYKINYSGEDVIDNLSLREKLRIDFGVELPVYEEEEGVEKYFKKVFSTVEGKAGWGIKRNVTLSLFNFGKLLMYLDLKPEEELMSHELIRKLFLGEHGGNTSSEDEYTEKEIDQWDRECCVLDSADSSQHSCIIDVLKGKNVVIEGPPGTGKSQTITNIIGALFNVGKSVLFVSEKLAALEVVKRRLDRMGLGDFCLELHSVNTQKSKLIQDIKKRTDMRSVELDMVALDRIVRQHARDKEVLCNYVRKINQKYMESEKTIGDILSSTARIRTEIQGYLHYFTTMGAAPDSRRVQEENLLDIKKKIEVYRQKLEHIFARFERIENHPWHGVENPKLSVYDKELVVKATELIEVDMCELLSRVKKFVLDYSLKSAITLKSTDKLLGEIATIPVSSGMEELRMLNVLKSENSRSQLRGLLSDLGRYKKMKDLLFVDNPNYKSHNCAMNNELLGAVKYFKGKVAEEIYVSGMVDIINRLANVKCLFEKNSYVFESFIKKFNISTQMCYSNVEVIRQIINVMSLCPEQALSLKGFVFDNFFKVSDTIDALMCDVDALKSSRDVVDAVFDLEKTITVEDVVGMADVIRNGGIFALFKSSYREARRKYLSIARNKKTFKVGPVLANLEIYKKYLSLNEAFLKKPEYINVYGSYLSVDSTPAQAISLMLKWVQAVREKLTFIWGVSTSPLEIIKNMGEEENRDFSQMAKASIGDIDRIIGLLCSVDTDITSDVKKTEGDLTKTISTILKGMESLVAFSREFNTPPSVANVERFLTTWKSFDEVNASLSNQKILSDYFAGWTTSIEAVVVALESTLILAEALSKMDSLGDVLSDKDMPAIKRNIINDASEINEKLLKLRQSIRHITELAHLREDLWWPEDKSLDDILLRIQKAKISQDDYEDWISYYYSKSQLMDCDLAECIDLIEKCHVPLGKINHFLLYKIFNDLAREILGANRDLNNFDGIEHSGVRSSFQKVDDMLIQMQRKLVARKLSIKPVPEGIDSPRVGEKTEFALLKHEMNKMRRHIPIRQLLLKSGEALRALKPCFMMGPLAVCQYLDRSNAQFDVLIIDEASQVKPEDALGAISRVKQVVIVGDTKQLPPTSFFQRTEDSEFSEDMVGMEENESILEVSSNVFKNSRMLRWHYRSQHESLIRYSNKMFYNNNLVLFPSPHFNDNRFGVKYQFVKGVYSAGKNPKEAKEVVQRIKEHILNSPNDSLGVVAMNSEQAELIEIELENLLKQEPELEEVLGRLRNGVEPFFIKNLENVQGDERDVIFISVVYGPDENGNVFQRFGPINSPNGWRRLNVLFTRSRKRTVVFSTMNSSQVIIGANASKGLQAFYGFLKFAETGSIPSEIVINEGQLPQSPFEEDVIAILERQGFKCVPQVGVAGYFIDIGIINPKREGSFIIGIECDGATYHSGKTARDRDRLRQMILEQLGWNIYRIWSVDWFKNKQRQIDKLITHINELSRM